MNEQKRSAKSRTHQGDLELIEGVMFGLRLGGQSRNLSWGSTVSTQHVIYA